MTDTALAREPSGAEKMFGDFAPGLVHFTDDVLFGEVWKRPQLSPRERSLITVAALTAGGNADQLTYHLQLATDNGATEEELIEAITHLAFYARPSTRDMSQLSARPDLDQFRRQARELYRAALGSDARALRRR